MNGHSKLYWIMRFCVKHVPNLIVRRFTNDKYYICEECKKTHKRDGKECRLDVTDGMGELMLNRWWYSSVCNKCYFETMNAVNNMLIDAISGKL